MSSGELTPSTPGVSVDFLAPPQRDFSSAVAAFTRFYPQMQAQRDAIIVGAGDSDPYVPTIFRNLLFAGSALEEGDYPKARHHLYGAWQTLSDVYPRTNTAQRHDITWKGEGLTARISIDEVSILLTSEDTQLAQLREKMITQQATIGVRRELAG